MNFIELNNVIVTSIVKQRDIYVLTVYGTELLVTCDAIESVMKSLYGSHGVIIKTPLSITDFNEIQLNIRCVESSDARFVTNIEISNQSIQKTKQLLFS
jgi:hypothetical protein